MKLAVPLHPDWLGSITLASYLQRLHELQVQSVEIALPPTFQPRDSLHWQQMIEAAAASDLTIAIHAPLPTLSTAWPTVVAWLNTLAASAPILIVHSCTAARPSSALVDQTKTFVANLIEQLLPTVTVALEQGWNWGNAVGLPTARRWMQDQQRQRRQRQRPSGVGSGLGSASPTHTIATAQVANTPDPPLQHSWRRLISRAGGWSGTGTRADTLRIVQQLDRPQCVIGWDLAHDWLGHVCGQATEWTTVPSAAFMDQIGYVRVHDVDDRYRDHQPLVMGNVPYTAQLRALQRTNFRGTVCVAVRYTASVQPFGDRWAVLERSLTITRQALRLHL